MAQNNNLFAQMFSQNDFTKSFEQYQNFPVDMVSIMETQRKNLQALTEAQQLAIEGMQAVAQRQSELVSKIVEDNAKIAKELMGEGTPEQKIARNADLFKKVYESSVQNLREIAEMMSKSNNEACEIINKRVSASIGEIKSALAKAQKKAA